jgi:hypothetical protein
VAINVEINGFHFDKFECTNSADTRDVAEVTTWTWSKDATSDTVGDADAALGDGSVRLIGTSDALALSDFHLI